MKAQPPPELFIKRFLKSFRRKCNDDGRFILVGDITKLFVQEGFEAQQLALLVQLLKTHKLLRCTTGKQITQAWILDKDIEDVYSFPSCILVFMKKGQKVRCDW